MTTPPTLWLVANTTWYIFNFRRRLMEELKLRGYTLVALSPADEYVQKVRALGVRHVHLEMDNAGTNALRDVALIAKLLMIFRRERPALLLTFTPKINIYCSLAAAATGTPVIANISGLGSGFIRGGWVGKVIRLLYRIALRHPRRIFFQNGDDHRLFVSQGLAPAGRSDCLPGSGVDLAHFRPPPPKSSQGPFVFLMVGRLLRDKGVREYAEAASMVRARRRDVEFHLVGFLDSRNPTAILGREVEEWERRGWLRFLGHTDDPRPYYGQADCVVLPSYREGCPRTLLEAAAMAKPVIATDVPGCRQVVDDGRTGLLAKVADAANLASKMEHMLALSSEARQLMGRSGREKMIQQFDENFVLRRYCELVHAIAPAVPAFHGVPGTPLSQAGRQAGRE